MPGVRFIMGAEPPPHFIWLFSLVVGLVLLFFNEMRKYFIRKYPQNAVVRIFKWWLIVWADEKIISTKSLLK